MPYNDLRINALRIKKLVRKNIVILKRNYFIGGAMFINFVVLFSNISGTGNDMIGFLRKDAFESAAFRFMPVLLLILFWGIYREEVNSGRIKVDLLFGYTRDEIIGVKLSVGVVVSTLLFLLPFTVIYVILLAVRLAGGMALPDAAFPEMNKTALFIVLEACLIYVLLCGYLNSAFLAVLLAFKMPLADRARVLTGEMMMFMSMWIFWDSLVIKISLNILGLLLAARAFRKVDL